MLSIPGGLPLPVPNAAMSFFGFGQSAELELVLSDAESRRRAEHKTEEGKKEKYFLFYDGETVSGRVILTLKHPNKRLEHQGIKVEFIGQIGKKKRQIFFPRGSLWQLIEPPCAEAAYLSTSHAWEQCGLPVYFPEPSRKPNRRQGGPLIQQVVESTIKLQWNYGHPIGLSRMNSSGLLLPTSA